MDFPISVPSIGLVDGKFVDEDPLLGTPGSLIPAQWGNAVTEEVLHVITEAGLTPAELDNTQLAVAIRLINKQPVLLTDTGVVNAYAAANSPALTAFPAKGFVQRIVITNSNTGPATYAPDGLAAKPIYGLGLQPLQGGELPAGVAILMYLVQAGVNGGSGAWIIIESLGGASQIAPATKSQHAVNLGQVSGIVGQVRSLKMSVTAASATATLTADEIVVETALGGLRYCLASFSKTINLATTGAGGMDTGTAPVSGFVSLYAIYNPTTATAALLACAQATSNGSIYSGANMPVGYTASALISSWPTNAGSQFVVGYQLDRKIYTDPFQVISSSTQQASLVSLSVALAAPINAKTVDLIQSGAVSSAGFAFFAAGDSTGISQRGYTVNSTGIQGVSVNDIPLITAQTIYYKIITSGSLTAFTLNVTSYTF